MHRIIFIFFVLFNFTNLSFGQGYQTQLNKINDYLKTFDKGYYGYLEIKEGYLFDRFKSGKYSKVLINDLDKATIAEANRKVIINCKNSSDCVYSTYTNSYHPQMSFSQSYDFDDTQLVFLLNNLITAYKISLEEKSNWNEKDVEMELRKARSKRLRTE